MVRQAAAKHNKQKRSASAKSRGRPSKKAKQDGVIGTIVDALKLSEKKDVPEDFTSRLAPVLEQSLTTFKEERHEFQSTVIDMAAKALTASEAVLLEEIASLEVTVSTGDEQRTQREAAVTAAEQRLPVCQEAHRAAQEAKADKVRAWKASAELLKEIQANQKKEDAEGETLDQQKADFEKLVAELLEPMKEASGRPAGNAAKLKALVKRLAYMELEDSLIQAIKLPLSKKPEQRGRLDAVILEQLDLQLAEQRAALEAKLNDIAPSRDARAASVQAAQDAHDQAKTASDAATEELRAAKEAEAAAKAEMAAAKEGVKNLSTDLLAAAKQLERSREALEAFRSGPLASFNELKERVAPVPQPEEAEEAVAEAPEAAATTANGDASMA
eukprot:TRINITY_DN63273_c0_g1_i1.p1 TRINITY_DN63273_c0_g1~~TRINITY_DN63273_c0_g1_i1.p1  ORF type:complete len:405 (+),score=138.85 TRINITY_DN63273_c0_g1_i1:55-1215(+)